MYKLFCVLMLVGFAGVGLQGGDLKTKIIAGLLFIVNAMLFWR